MSLTTGTAILGAAALLGAAAAGSAAQTSPDLSATKPVAATSATPAAGTAKKGSAKKGPPLDFSGVWVIDEKASRGVSKNMEGAVLSVRQNGNRIWIEPVDTKGVKLLSEEIVVDGKKYEKGVGAGQKGTLEASWGKDGKSLWLQAIAGTDENPNAAIQRMIWKLQDGGRTWTRQTRTIQPDEVKDTFLVFRKREPPKK